VDKKVDKVDPEDKTKDKEVPEITGDPLPN